MIRPIYTFLINAFAAKLLFSHKFVVKATLMERSEKKLTELGKLLDHGSVKEINERLKMLRAEEPFIGALKMLALFYDKTDDHNLRAAISGLFNDMKERSAMAEVIESVAVVRKPDTMVMLISSCWQSGHDYSPFALPLTEYFIAGDYMISLECFTVLDTCSASISDSDRSQIIIRLQEEKESWETPKQKLAVELITLLKG